ncbi:tyrosine-type recombinase/integrase [Adhaeretor mobilis]|uniref:Site-specific tyrosine recombinase XerC n=1 Tax=Adhaeretor mobilis TaxID=1930276 RepID=A0A517MWL4_9BACT|nr:site-specific integrase [Adhaeretor mobilis]QDS99268.1 site-specific tyrosine recombinase XerC [Adhaeretor mobilis]
MPRLLKKPPKYGRHKASGQACVYVNGTEVYLGKYGSPKSHDRYRDFLAEWRSQQAVVENSEVAQATENSLAKTLHPAALRRKRREGGVVTLDELIFVYRRHASSYYVKYGKVTREAELIVELTTLLGKKHGDEPVDEFGPVQLDNFRDDLIVERDWSRKVINKQISRLIRMFKWAVGKEMCAAEVPLQLSALGGLKKGRTDARETAGVRGVEDTHIEQTLPCLPAIVADMVKFQRLTGARPGEVCALRPCDINSSGDVWIYVPNEHKTEHHEKTREVYLGPQAQEVLAPYLERDEASYCFSPEESIAKARQRQQLEKEKPWTRKKPDGTTQKTAPNRYQVSSYRVAVRRGCNKAGVTVWTPNQLRHTAATVIRKKYGLEAAQVICGHEKADVTQVYAERDKQLAEKVAREMG